MAIPVSKLIEKLKEKDQNAEVEFVVVETNGNLVCMDLANNTKDMAKLLKMFGD